jgi:actin-related protein 5
LLTETLCNPNYSRANVSELLFECYGFNNICYGVDGLFSFFQNQNSPKNAKLVESGLIINAHNACTHVIPVLDGKVQVS